MSHDHSRHDHDHGRRPSARGGHAHAHGSDAGGHGHVHAPADFGRAFAIGIALNTGFVAVEAGFGLASNSVALLADAGHNLSDVLGLLIAWAGTVLARRGPTPRFTYGLRASSNLAALLNALILLLAIGAIGWESAQRLFRPEPVGGTVVIVVAAVGIVINGFTAWLFAAGAKGDINIRGAYLHMAADAAVSGGVVASGLAMAATGWLWLDPLTSLVIVAVIFVGTWSLLRESVVMSLGAVPAGLVLDDVRGLLAARPGVVDVHDLHVWSMSTTDVALTAHLVMPAGHPGDGFLAEAARDLRERFGIGHATLQVERDPAACALAQACAV